MRRALGGLVVALAVTSPAIASAPPSCVALGALLSPQSFAKYPAVVARGPWRAPDVRDGEARSFRTMLRAEAQTPPDFAGRIKVVRLGCGAGAICPALVDRLTGRVGFAPHLRVVNWLPGDGGGDDRRLTYRPDSRLLVVVGQRNEQPQTAGASLYEWRDRGVRLLRFVPQHRLCDQGGKR